MLFIQKPELDQFYTKPEIAKQCYNHFLSCFSESEFDFFIEPSAGAGAFFKLMPVGKRVGIDIDSNLRNIKKQNFFDYNPPNIYKNIAVLGNPPFGKKSKLAIAFFNHAAQYADTIAFIVPIQFQKWSVQSKLDNKFNLISELSLPDDAFLLNRKTFSVRCIFQLWTQRNNLGNIRLKEKPPTTHPDFEMYLYNNTLTARKVFEKDFDFAVPRQGYYDYSIRESNKANCSLNIQWMLFKAKNKQVLDRLFRLDFNALAKKNTSTPGYGKADVIQEYSKLL